MERKAQKIGTTSQDLSRDAGIEGRWPGLRPAQAARSQDLSRDAGIEGSSGARSSGSTVPSQDLSRDAGIVGLAVAAAGVDHPARNRYPDSGN